MVSLISPTKAQQKIAQSVRERRILSELTQEGLSERSGVPLATLRKFEQKGLISLESLLKILLVVGGLEELTDALKPSIATYNSIEEVLKDNGKNTRKRGRRK